MVNIIIQAMCIWTQICRANYVHKKRPSHAPRHASKPSKDRSHLKYQNRLLYIFVRKIGPRGFQSPDKLYFQVTAQVCPPEQGPITHNPLRGWKQLPQLLKGVHLHRETTKEAPGSQTNFWTLAGIVSEQHWRHWNPFANNKHLCRGLSQLDVFLGV